MNEREELATILKEWSRKDGIGEMHFAKLLDRVLAAGYAKTLDVSELVEYDLTRQGFVDKGALVNEKWYRSSDVRRLAAPKERWVSCAERLPQARVEVLILWKGTVLIASRETEEPSYEESFRPFDFWCHEHEEVEDGDVTAWCELPPPPTNPAQTAKEGV